LGVEPEGEPKEVVAKDVLSSDGLRCEARIAQCRERTVYGRLRASHPTREVFEAHPLGVVGELDQHGEDAVSSDHAVLSIRRHVTLSDGPTVWLSRSPTLSFQVLG
jgi:hypothetical protein